MAAWEQILIVIEKGADPDIQNDNGSLIFQAAQANQIKIVERILKLNISTKEKNKVLLSAAKNKFWEIVRLLFENGADINTREEIKLQAESKNEIFNDTIACSVLQYAAEEGNKEIITYLLKKNPTMEDRTCALSIAIDRMMWSAAILLIESKTILPENSYKLVTYGLCGFTLDEVKILLSNGFDKSKILMHISCVGLKAPVEIIKYLVEEGANEKSKTEILVQLNDVTLIKYLVDHGANVNEKISFLGITLLSYAMESRNASYYSPEVIQLFASLSDSENLTKVFLSRLAQGDMKNVHLLVKYIDQKTKDTALKDFCVSVDVMKVIEEKNWEILKYIAESGYIFSEVEENTILYSLRGLISPSVMLGFFSSVPADADEIKKYIEFFQNKFNHENDSVLSHLFFEK